MKKLIILSFIVSLLLPISAFSKTRVESDGNTVYNVGVLFDVSSEIGYQHKDIWIGRLRLGPTFVRTPWFATVATLVGIQSNKRPIVGVQAELMHSESGVWVQASGIMDTAVTADVFLSAGWSVAGYEYQIRNKAHVFKIKLPFSMVYYGMTRSW